MLRSGFRIALALAALACAACPGRPGGDGPGTAASAPTGPTGRTPPARALSWTTAAADVGRTGAVADPGPETLPGIVWSATVEPNVVSEPVLARGPKGELVLVGSGENVLALDAERGTTVWQHVVGSLVNAAPLPVGDRCFVAGTDAVGALVSLADGSVLKKLEFDFVLEASPAFAGGSILFEETSVSSQSPNSILYALDPATGATRWRWEYPNGVAGVAAADGERVYVTVADGLRAARLADGVEQWHWPRDRAITQYGPLARDGRLYEIHGGMQPWDAGCLDAATGKPIWTAKLPGRGCAPPALAASHLLVPMVDATLVRVSISDGKVEIPRALAARVETRPAVGRKLAYLGAGTLVLALDRETLEEAWRLDVGGPIAWVTIDGERLLVARLDGFLHCLGA